MKRLLLLAAVAIAASGCSAIRDLRTDENPYENPFYAKYLHTGSNLDAQITRTLVALRQNPGAPELHNTLGALLVEKGFPKDAAREFERAINLDRRYFPAWYNLGLVRESLEDHMGARRAFARTVSLKPGHAAALFQLGLIEEERQHTDRAVELYAKAFTINPALLRVDVNPRILDAKLTHLALLHAYPSAHARRSMQFQEVGATPRMPEPEPARLEAPSPQQPAKAIVTPAPPATDRSQQKPPAPAPATPPAQKPPAAKPPAPKPPAAATPAKPPAPATTAPARTAGKPATAAPATQPAKPPAKPPAPANQPPKPPQ